MYKRMKARSLRRAMSPIKGCAKRSMFYGDPVEIDEQMVADAIEDPSVSQEVIDSAVIQDAPSDEAAVERLQTFDQMSNTERSEVTMVPPLSVHNAVIIVKPVTRGILANNLNYLLQKCMVDFPSLGIVKLAEQVDPVNDPSHFAVTFDARDYPNSGLKGIPFFRFNLSASTLNARPGGNYNIWIEGTTENEEIIKTEPYTFQRVVATEAVLGIMVPFRVIATRTLPALGLFGSADRGTGVPFTPSFTVHITGMDPSGAEIFTVTQPGYSTAETRVISELFSLPAGMNF